MADKSKPRTVDAGDLEAVTRWRLEVLLAHPGSGKELAKALLDLADEATSPRPQITNEKLQERTGRGRRAVQYALKALEQKDLIRRTKVGGGKGEPRQEGSIIEMTLPAEAQEKPEPPVEPHESRAPPAKNKPGRYAPRPGTRSDRGCPAVLGAAGA